MIESIIMLLHVCVCDSIVRWLVCAREVAALLAAESLASLHGARLQPSTVGTLVLAHLPDLHTLDRPLLLPHGVDGTKHALTHLDTRANNSNSSQTPFVSFCSSFQSTVAHLACPLGSFSDRSFKSNRIL